MIRSTPVEDFLVATSDRRRELRGERWEGLRRGVAPSFPLAPLMDRTRPHPRFEKGVVFETHDAVAYEVPEPSESALTASAKLSTLLRTTVWPMRWEPLNGCGQHRAVGTPGALFPVDVYLLAQTRGGARVLHCSPRDLCLLEVRALSDAAAGETAQGLSIVAVGNLGRCVGIYGDLALGLCALEAGMLQAQTALVAHGLGWRVNAAQDHDHEALRALLGIAHWSEVPLVRCRVSGDGAAAAADLRERRLQTIRPLPHHADADRHPLLRRFVGLASPPLPAAQGVPAVDTDISDKIPLSIKDISRLRTSGIGNGIVRWTQDFSAALLDAVLADTRHLLRDAGGAARLAVSLVWRPTQAGAVRLFEVDPAQARTTEVAASADTLDAARGMCRYSAGLLITIGADATAGGPGARPRIDDLVRAGVLAQCFSLAAARNGLAARLFMAYPDDLKNLLMPLQMRALVQILVGFDTRPNPAFPIG